MKKQLFINKLILMCSIVFSQAHYFMETGKHKQKAFEKAPLFFENALKIYPDYDKAVKALNNVLKILPK